MTIRDIPDIHAFVERHRKHMMESFADFIDAKRAWSLATFGPGERVTGVTRHIEKEIEEIRKQPNDVMEWADLIILALDGACRQGFTGQQIMHAVHEKHRINTQRTWPDWTTIPPDQPIEHERTSHGTETN